MNITLTDQAAKFIGRMLRFNGGSAASGFRLTVTQGGCSGFNSSFTVEGSPRPGDSTLEDKGIRLFLPEQSRLLLEGVTIDFADTATTDGFRYINPNLAPSACGGEPQRLATVSLASIRRMI